jgi:hypothetical protein
MRWSVFLVAALVLTTGCLGMGGDDATSTDDTAEPATDDNATSEDEPEQASPEPTIEWRNETYEGTVTGTTVFTPGATSEGDGQSFTFDAAPGIQTLFVNLTAEGGELTMNVAGPDCEINSPCEESVETSGGEAQYVNETPTSGEWNVRFFVEPAGAQVDYTANVVQGVNATTGAS